MIVKRLRLSNRLPVILADIKATEAVTVLVLVHTGSRQESAKEAGLSHFLEHMVFKGTTSWPTASQLTHLIDSLGADYNAFTSKEITGFYIKAASEHLPMILHILSEMVWQPILDKEEIKREKEVIVQEINMYEDNPIMYVEDLLEQKMFAGHPLGRLISGTRESVRSLKSEQVRKYLNKFYQPQNMLVIAAGKITASHKKYFAKYFSTPRPRASRLVFKSPRVTITKPQIILKHKETEQVQIAIGFKALPLRSKDAITLEILSTILGGNMSSRLFVRIREREGLCYFIKTGVQAYEQAGLVVIQAGLDKDRLPQAIKLIKEELSRITKELVTSAELTKAKDYLKGRLLLALEDSAGVADWLGKQIMLEHKLETTKQVLAKLQAVTPGGLKRLARAIFKPECYTLAVIGPYQNTKILDNLLRK